MSFSFDNFIVLYLYCPYIFVKFFLKVKTTDFKNGLQEDEFKESDTMSTYLVAFIVAEFSSYSRNVSDTTVCILLKIIVFC